MIKDCHLYDEKLEKIHVLSQESKKLGIKLIAEGIEKSEEWTVLQDLVDYGQGYLFGKPSPVPVDKYTAR
ncbi:EAL domain-containing protein [Evansella tamaricis]|nr:EAL domain-containing protein [Evansella tamaricis]